MKNKGKQLRSALLIRCTVEEAHQIREAAERERRTVSGFVLNAVLNRIAQHNAPEAVDSSPHAEVWRAHVRAFFNTLKAEGNPAKVGGVHPHDLNRIVSLQ